MNPVQRIAIIVHENLEPGRIANVAAIVMGQAALLHPQIYDQQPLQDQSHIRHAAIRYSTVILKAKSPSQLVNFVKKVHTEHPTLTCIVFCEAGFTLNNAFEAYQAYIVSHATMDLVPAGVLVTGDDDIIRMITKKFSLLR